VAGPAREPDGDELQFLWGRAAASPGPLRAPGGASSLATQEERVHKWPVPAQAGQGRDRGSAVGVTMV
jgi:hypothetical protein